MDNAKKNKIIKCHLQLNIFVAERAGTLLRFPKIKDEITYIAAQNIYEIIANDGSIARLCQLRRATILMQNIIDLRELVFWYKPREPCLKDCGQVTLEGLPKLLREVDAARSRIQSELLEKNNALKKVYGMRARLQKFLDEQSNSKETILRSHFIIIYKRITKILNQDALSMIFDVSAMKELEYYSDHIQDALKTMKQIVIASDLLKNFYFCTVDLSFVSKAQLDELEQTLDTLCKMQQSTADSEVRDKSISILRRMLTNEKNKFYSNRALILAELELEKKRIEMLLVECKQEQIRLREQKVVLEKKQAEFEEQKASANRVRLLQRFQYWLNIF